MLEFLKRLFSLNADTSHRKRAGFRLLDVEDEAEKMRVEHHGRKDGARDVPASEQHRNGTVESQIIEMGKNLLQENLQHYEQEFQSYSARLAALTPEGMLSDARLQTQGLLSSIAALPQRHAARLSEHRSKVAQVHKELKLFQHDNGLSERAARYPDSRILHGSIMLVIVVLESFLNATLLAEGNELGLLGGWTEAILISLINAVAIGYILCRGIRWSICYRFSWKVVGSLVLIAGVAAAVMFNLGVAHYRNALGGESPELAGVVAWEMLTTNPGDIGDIKSMMLFLFGLLIVGLATLDWLLMDDIYPNYGHLTRKHIEAHGEYAEFHHWLVHEELQDLRDEVNEIISKYLSTAAQAATEDSRVLDRMSKLNDRLIEAVDNVEGGVNRLLRIYREANVASRETDPPEYFDREWRYEREVSRNKVPAGREMPPIETFTSVLEPLHQELDRSYKESLRVLNEMNE